MIEGSCYSHPFQATADGRKTRTYKTAESRDRRAQLWADEIGQTVSIWEHSTQHGWMLAGRVEPTKTEPEEVAEVEGCWPCKVCRAPVEATPSLFLTLDDDGTWEVTGVGDETAQVECQNGHAQDDPELDKSLRAFLEETFPGGTWPRG